MHTPQENPSKLVTFWPLIVIVSMILLVSAVTAWDGNALEYRPAFRNFMAGFFLVFSGFKFLNLKAFSKGYSTYDLLAMRVPLYGFVYPFFELGLGLAYLTNWQPYFTNMCTLILMTFSGVGVMVAVMKKRNFQCACLGTIINVPLTHITLVEDFGMAIMAAVMLL